MAGYWPSSFFACLWTEMKSRSINWQKKTRRIQTNLVNKRFIIWLSGKFCLRIQRVVPSGQGHPFVENHATKWGSNDRSPIQETRLE